MRQFIKKIRLEVVVLLFLVLLFAGSSVAAIQEVAKGDSLALIDKVVTDVKGTIASIAEEFRKQPQPEDKVVQDSQIDENSDWQDVVGDEIKTDFEEVLIPTKTPTVTPTKYYWRATPVPTKTPTKPLVTTKPLPTPFDQEAWWRQVRDDNRKRQAEWARQMEEFKKQSQANMAEFQRQANQGATDFARQSY